MNAWIILLAITAVAALFVMLPVGAAILTRHRRPRSLRCPMTGRDASVQIDVPRATLGELIGRRALRIRSCSRWPRAWACRQQCLAAEGVDVRAELAATRATWPGARTILVPLDGTAADAAVVAAVGSLARDQRAVVRLMCTVAMPPSVQAGDRIVVYADKEADRIEAEARDGLNALAERMPGVRTATVVRFGPPVAEIVAEAEASGVDLIAMATDEHPVFGWSRRNHLAGAVASSTRIPVLRVPCAPRGVGSTVRDRPAPLSAVGWR
jgi:nucleotide-binding universal stress UspA family protein